MKLHSGNRRYAFILPRFVQGLAGGAETLTALLAQQLASRGDTVELWTTCARDNRTWLNELAEGKSLESGLVVRRFPVSERNLDVWVENQIRIADGMSLDLDSQFDWMTNGVNSAALNAWIEKEHQNFDLMFFAPYLFGTTFFGSLIAPHKSVLIPCLHDESYAYLNIIGSMFRQVRGAIFNSSAEQELAQRLYGRIAGGVVGMGFEAPAASEAAQLKPFFKESFPYAVYLGRKETGKGAHTLIDYFQNARARMPHLSNLKLVICGGGEFSDLNRPDALVSGEVIDIAHVDEQQKKRLLRNAAVLIQPSLNESFSIVLMEAWLLGTPVLVNAHCAVTRGHVLESGGGLYYSSADDFAGVLSEIVSNARLRECMGKAGYDYVLKQYDWKIVLARFGMVVDELLHENHVVP